VVFFALSRIGQGRFGEKTNTSSMTRKKKRAVSPGESAGMSIESAIDFLDQHFQEKPSLDALAERCGMCKYKFIRAFSKATGSTPGAYVLKRRLACAMSLIDAGVPLTRVALESGFYDQSHFIRTFRKYCGSTPGGFRIQLDNHLLINSIKS
jgi:AraC-like DNA-binding protein